MYHFRASSCYAATSPEMTDRLQPAIDRITSNPWVQRNFPALADPDLWHVNRRSAARAVAIGLFCGLIPGPLQALAAVVACLVVRANFPHRRRDDLLHEPVHDRAAVRDRLRVRTPVLPERAAERRVVAAAVVGTADWMPALLHWMAQLGKPLAVGLVMLAATLATAGWASVRVAWRCHAVWAWRRRARLRAHARVPFRRWLAAMKPPFWDTRRRDAGRRRCRAGAG